jgi:hypothetical protein
MTGKLTALAVARAKERGTLGDGGGLYLQIARGGTKSWILRYKRDGRTRHLGLGPLSVVSLREARQRAVDARRLLLDGHDPIEKKATVRAADPGCSREISCSSQAPQFQFLIRMG